MRFFRPLFMGLLALLVIGSVRAAAEIVDAPVDPRSFVSKAEVSPQSTDPRDTLSVSASVSPPGMAVPQSAQVYLTLANSATDPITDIRVLRGGQEVAVIGTLSGSGQSSYVFDESVTPTYRQLRAGGIEYVVRYRLGQGDDAPRREVTVLAPVSRIKAEPSLEFTRSLSANYAQIGEEVTITYRLRNTGNVALTDLSVKDSLGGEVGRLDTLLPGKREQFTSKVTIEETCDSKPQASYNYAGSEKALASIKLDPLTIYLADERLEAQLSADKSAVSPGEVVTLTIKITNRGNVTYDKLAISDQVLGTLGSVPGELKPGAEHVFIKHVAIKSTTTFLFSVAGKSMSGSPISASSNMLTVAVTPAVSDIKLEISAAPDHSLLDAPGPVNFTVTIHNGGELDIRNVMLTEQTSGEIKLLAVVPPGDTPIEQQYALDGPRQFVFMAEMSDAQGGRLTKLSAPVEVGIRPGGVGAPTSPAPGNTALLGLQGTVYHMEENANAFSRMVLVVLIVLGVLMLMFVVGALTRLGRRRKQKKLRIKKLKRSNRSARLLSAQEQRGEQPPQPGEDTGVYRKSDLVPK